MQIQNGLVFCPDGTLKRQTVSTRGDRILETGEGPVLDASGCIVAPGFIDCHIHGACNHDFCEASPQAHGAIARFPPRGTRRRGAAGQRSREAA